MVLLVAHLNIACEHVCQCRGAIIAEKKIARAATNSRATANAMIARKHREFTTSEPLRASLTRLLVVEVAKLMGELQFDQETTHYAARVHEAFLGEDIEVFFQGTPTEFAAALHATADRLSARLGESFCVLGGTSELNKDLAVFDFPSMPIGKGFGRVVAQSARGGGTLVFVTSYHDIWSDVVRAWAVVFRELQRQGWFPPEGKVRKVRDTSCKQGPTYRTRVRFDVMKRIKDQHPDWSQDKVGTEAGIELGEFISGEAVRNTFRSMGAEWVRADRVR